MQQYCKMTRMRAATLLLGEFEGFFTKISQDRHFLARGNIYGCLRQFLSFVPGKKQKDDPLY